VLLVCGCQHLASALGEHAAWLLHLTGAPSPALALHQLGDLVTSPLLLANLGYLTGQGVQSMLPAIAASVMGGLGALGSELCTSSSSKALALGMSFGSTAVAWQQVSTIQERAREVSAENLLRAQLAGTLMVHAWWLYPLVQTLGFCGVLPEHFQLGAVCALDLLAKYATSHLMLKSTKAVRNAARHFAPRPIIMSEPHCEPPPRNG